MASKVLALRGEELKNKRAWRHQSKMIVGLEILIKDRAVAINSNYH